MGLQIVKTWYIMNIIIQTVGDDHVENSFKKNKKFLAYIINKCTYKEQDNTRTAFTGNDDEMFLHYYEDDYVSEKLIQVYQEYIFTVDLENKEQVNKLRMIDKILAKYIEDYNFRHELKTGLLKIKVKKSSSNILEVLVNSIIDLFDNYETTFTRTIYIARWI